jgi:superfamily I DNA/RNA helicase
MASGTMRRQVLRSSSLPGPGSGKTNTLAHRVAHLIVNGADPRKILLMTFSRLAAAEMARRVERIARRVIGDSAGIMTDALWAGTFHGIGARLLRDYAGVIGLDPAFTIHDREDSADLMNLMRHELGFSKIENADRGCAGNVLSMVRRLGRRAEAAVRWLCRGEAKTECSRL